MTYSKRCITCVHITMMYRVGQGVRETKTYRHVRELTDEGMRKQAHQVLRNFNS